MNYVAASSLMTAFGETPVLAVWRWGVALDLGYIPRLSEAQQRVGFNGIKLEDLNRSPVFGRLRLILGLPGDFVAELGYTPPLSIDGTQPLDLVALSIGRRLFEHDSFTLSAQLFGQHGRAQGDITCPARLAGIADGQQNPFGCRAPSNDHIKLNYYGAELTSAWTAGALACACQRWRRAHRIRSASRRLYVQCARPVVPGGSWLDAFRHDWGGLGFGCALESWRGSAVCTVAGTARTECLDSKRPTDEPAVATSLSIRLGAVNALVERNRTRRYGRHPGQTGRACLALLGVELQFLDLARQRVAAPAQALRRFHPMPAGVRERAHDQRSLEFLFEPVADGEFASGERLGQFAVERLLPVAFVVLRIRRRGRCALQEAGRRYRFSGPAPSPSASDRCSPAGGRFRGKRRSTAVSAPAR